MDSLPIQRRAFLASGLSNLGLLSCCREYVITGNDGLLSRLSLCSRERGLGIAVLRSDALATRYFNKESEVPTRKSLRDLIDHLPAMLVDWGRALVLQDGNGLLSVIDLNGNKLGELKGTHAEGCVLHRSTQRLLFWSKSGKDQSFSFEVAELGNSRVSTVFQHATNDPYSNVTASFVEANPLLIRISIGWQSYLVGLNGKVLAQAPWSMEFIETAPDGRTIVGRQANGRLAFVDVGSERVVDSGVTTIGYCKWDPSSRYVFTLGLTHAVPWCSPVELVIVDAHTHDIARLPALIPHKLFHSYYWVLLPA